MNVPSCVHYKAAKTRLVATDYYRACCSRQNFLTASVGKKTYNLFWQADAQFQFKEYSDGK